MPTNLQVGVGILDVPIAQGIETEPPVFVTDTGLVLVTDTGVEIVKNGS